MYNKVNKQFFHHYKFKYNRIMDQSGNNNTVGATPSTTNDKER